WDAGDARNIHRYIRQKHQGKDIQRNAITECMHCIVVRIDGIQKQQCRCRQIIGLQTDQHGAAPCSRESRSMMSCACLSLAYWAISSILGLKNSNLPDFIAARNSCFSSSALDEQQPVPVVSSSSPAAF